METIFQSALIILCILLVSGHGNAGITSSKISPEPPRDVIASENGAAANKFDPASIRRIHKKEDYSDFRVVSPGKVIDQGDLRYGSILLGEGDYVVNNPLVIDESSPIAFIHGIDRMHSRLVPLHRNKPLLIVRNAVYVNITNIHLTGFDAINGTNVLTEGDENIVFDLVDCFVERGALSIKAPGSYRMQGNYLTGQGLISSQIILDNDAADLYVFGGNLTQSGLERGGKVDEFSHIWVKAGRFRMFGTGLQGVRGLADIRIDRSAPFDQTHQIINVRSEGNNGKTRLGSSFVYVPNTSDSVNIDVVNSAGSWSLSGLAKSALAIYNGSGRLQLVGNSSSEGAGKLVARNVQGDFQLAAIGNTLSSPIAQPEFASNKAELIANLYGNTRIGSRIVATPKFRMADNNRGFVQIPLHIEIPPLLERPKLVAALPGMISVKDFGASGDGMRDDGRAIQRAINTGRAVYFPEGNYKISQPLKYNVKKQYDHGAGGFIAGAGSDKVTIFRDGHGSIFETQGMAYATVQGLTLKSNSGHASSSASALLVLEFTPGVGHATQSNSFYDITIDGADTGIAIGNVSPMQCSENLFSDLVIRNAKVGISVGSYNALANIFANVDMQNVEVAIGQEGKLTGGSWSIVGGRFSGVEKLFHFLNSSDGIFFFDGIKAAQIPLFYTNDTGAIFNIFLNRSSLSSTPFELKSAGGIFINDTTVTDFKGSAHGVVSENYLINNSNSRVRDLVQAKNGSVILGK